MSYVIRPTPRNLLLAFLCAAALVLSFALTAPPQAQACPSQEVDYTYYTDATYTVPCGYKIIPCSCGGGAQYGGCVTSYYTIDWYPC